jgi:hypothetical protein
MDYGLGFGFTVIVFISSFFIFPLFFLVRRDGKARKRLLGIQIGLFVYWNFICWAVVILPGFESSVRPSTSGPGGSISLSYWLVTPMYAAFIIIEYLILRRAAKRRKLASLEDGLSLPTE